MTSSVYNYMNNAKVILPMTAACHDATNLRTLDVSGNGLHFRFGDGVTAGTYPAKLATRGYSFNGSSQYLEALANQTNAINEGTWAILCKCDSSFYGVNPQMIYGHLDATNVRSILYLITNQIRFYSGDAINSSLLAITAIPIGQTTLLVGRRTTDGYRRLYCNELNSTPDNLGTTLPSTAVTTNPRIGARYNNTNYMKGNVYWYGHWEYALTELQLRDLEMRLRRQLNDV